MMTTEEYRSYLLNRFLPLNTGPHRLSMEQVFENEPFTWGSDTLYTQGKARSKYIDAIYQANDYNFQPLVDFARDL